MTVFKIVEPDAPPIEAAPIRIEPNRVTDIVDQIEAALIQGNKNLYQRSGKIVYPCFIKGKSHKGEDTHTPGLEEVGLNRLYEFADSAASYEKWSKTSKGWIACDAPRDMVAVLRERGGDLRLPILRATINTPIVFPDGRILDQPGYDAASGLLYDPEREIFPTVPISPTKEDAIAALAVINEPLAHYKFKDSGDTEQTPAEERGRISRAVAWALMITGVVRPALDLAPGGMISASTIGSGKGKLAAVISVLAVGDKPRTITQGEDNKEFEKRLVSELRVNTGIISIGNCVHPIGGPLLEEFLTNQRINPRILGLSENINVDNTNLILWNGNNLQIQGDAVRRFVRLYIAPDVEFAYKTTYSFDPIEYVREHRVRIVLAVLTLLRAYVLADDKPGLEALGNFDLWSYFVRGAIVWAGGADPVKSQDDIVQADEFRQDLCRVMYGWQDVVGEECANFYPLQFIIEQANRNDENARVYQGFYDALVDVGVTDTQNRLSAKKFGHWLKKHENEIAEGRKFMKQFNSDRKSYSWGLHFVKPAASTG